MGLQTGGHDTRSSSCRRYRRNRIDLRRTVRPGSRRNGGRGRRRSGRSRSRNGSRNWSSSRNGSHNRSSSRHISCSYHHSRRQSRTGQSPQPSRSIPHQQQRRHKPYPERTGQKQHRQTGRHRRRNRRRTAGHKRAEHPSSRSRQQTFSQSRSRQTDR
ncbi:Uncharacterised protein [Neisseria meningitidis]|nr:Uncharacterised protein [Neisseria meningitidis]